MSAYIQLNVYYMASVLQSNTKPFILHLGTIAVLQLLLDQKLFFSVTHPPAFLKHHDTTAML